jgi:hypothetical protein
MAGTNHSRSGRISVRRGGNLPRTHPSPPGPDAPKELAVYVLRFVLLDIEMCLAPIVEAARECRATLRVRGPYRKTGDAIASRVIRPLERQIARLGALRSAQVPKDRVVARVAP